MSILKDLQSSADVKKLSLKELDCLSEELRNEIIETTQNNGGHLSANLGIVETTAVLYHVFDFPKDKLIFDVGHQCYAHKILSGRKDAFKTIRTDGGISGFPDCEESEYDAFGSGHAGTSIASSLGICEARDKNGQDFCVIDIVGDGALSNGLNLEAITSSPQKPKNFIVVLNDNGMSISKNTSGLYKLISKGTTKKGYIRSKNFIIRIVGKTILYTVIAKIKNFIKRLFGQNYFEQFGFKYVGICDGNDIKELDKILKRVKIACKSKAVILHIKTTKGKGLKVAEEHADAYHGVGKHHSRSVGEFSSALGEVLCKAIERNDKIVAITAGMKDGTGLKTVEEKFPKNFYDVGIAEEFAVTFSAGLARGGLKPVVAIYSTFLQRSYDQILHDVCIQNLPVTFCIDRSGVVGDDGKTHQGVFDISYLSHVPNMTILSPVYAEELQGALDYALSLNSPVAIRYPKSCCLPPKITAQLVFSQILWEEVLIGADGVILAVGSEMLSLALESSKRIKQDKNLDFGVVAVRGIKPLNISGLETYIGKTVITLEENSVIGGFGSMVCEYYSGLTEKTVVKVFGVKDEFVPHGSIKFQLDKNKLNVEEVVSCV